jgi:hypothetical protein
LAHGIYPLTFFPLPSSDAPPYNGLCHSDGHALPILHCVRLLRLKKKIKNVIRRYLEEENNISCFSAVSDICECSMCICKLACPVCRCHLLPMRISNRSSRESFDVFNR